MAAWADLPVFRASCATKKPKPKGGFWVKLAITCASFR